MTDKAELYTLRAQVLAFFPKAKITINLRVNTVCVHNVPGVGPQPMSLISAAERMREVCHSAKIAEQLLKKIAQNSGKTP